MSNFLKSNSSSDKYMKTLNMLNELYKILSVSNDYKSKEDDMKKLYKIYNGVKEHNKKYIKSEDEDYEE